MTVDISGDALIVEAAESPRWRTVAVLLPNTQSSGQVFGPNCKLMGVGLYNSAGVAVALRLYNGTSANAQEVLPTGLPGGIFLSTVWFGPGGIDCDGGIWWAGALTATCEFVVYVKYRLDD